MTNISSLANDRRNRQDIASSDYIQPPCRLSAPSTDWLRQADRDLAHPFLPIKIHRQQEDWPGCLSPLRDKGHGCQPTWGNQSLSTGTCLP